MNPTQSCGPYGIGPALSTGVPKDVHFSQGMIGGYTTQGMTPMVDPRAQMEYHRDVPKAVEAPRLTTATIAEDMFYSANRVASKARRIQQWLHYNSEGRVDPVGNGNQPTTLEEWQTSTFQTINEAENILIRILDRLGIDY